MYVVLYNIIHGRRSSNMSDSHLIFSFHLKMNENRQYTLIQPSLVPRPYPAVCHLQEKTIFCSDMGRAWEQG